MHTCISSHGLKRSWRSCPRRVNAGNKNTPSTHHPRRRNVTTLMVGFKKWAHTQKSHPKVVNPRDIAGEHTHTHTQKKTRKKHKWICSTKSKTNQHGHDAFVQTKVISLPTHLTVCTIIHFSHSQANFYNSWQVLTKCWHQIININITPEIFFLIHLKKNERQNTWGELFSEKSSSVPPLPTPPPPPPISEQFSQCIRPFVLFLPPSSPSSTYFGCWWPADFS